MGNVRMRAEQINYGATNVKVALDDLDPKDLIALSARMDTIEAWKATVKAEEKSGSSVEFTNALAIKAVAVSAEIEPIQDLHGYDKPWVGGAGKNKLPMTVASIKAANTSGTWSGNIYTLNNTTVEILTDETNKNVLGFKVNTGSGGVSANTIFNITGSINYASGNYIASVAGATVPSNVYISVRGTSLSLDLYDSAVSRECNIASDITDFREYVYVSSGVTLSNYIIQPMIRLATESDATFAPYSNICPISGHTSDTISQTDADEQTTTITILFVDENDDPVTVYGGTLNVTTGVMTVTHKGVDIGALAWMYRSSDHLYYVTVPDAKPAPSDSVAVSAITSCYPVVARHSLVDKTLAISDVSNVCVFNSDYSSASDFATAMTGQTLCYELATPTTIQLTANQLQMLKDHNRLSADTGDITVKAYTGSAWGGDTV